MASTVDAKTETWRVTDSAPPESSNGWSSESHVNLERAPSVVVRGSNVLHRTPAMSQPRGGVLDGATWQNHSGRPSDAPSRPSPDPSWPSRRPRGLDDPAHLPGSPSEGLDRNLSEPVHLSGSSLVNADDSGVSIKVMWNGHDQYPHARYRRHGEREKSGESLAGRGEGLASVRDAVREPGLVVRERGMQRLAAADTGIDYWNALGGGLTSPPSVIEKDLWGPGARQLRSDGLSGGGVYTALSGTAPYPVDPRLGPLGASNDVADGWSGGCRPGLYDFGAGEEGEIGGRGSQRRRLSEDDKVSVGFAGVSDGDYGKVPQIRIPQPNACSTLMVGDDRNHGAPQWAQVQGCLLSAKRREISWDQRANAIFANRRVQWSFGMPPELGFCVDNFPLLSFVGCLSALAGW